MSNEIAVRLQLPLLLVSRPSADFVKAFRKRLEYSASLLSKTNPNAILVIAIDAADNSVTVAKTSGLNIKSFVHDLMSFQDIPSNVRLVISGRSGRLNELDLPNDFHKVLVKSFTPAETALNVRRYWDAPQRWIDEFHELSHGIPRVQGYALEREAPSHDDRIEFLRPSGKDLKQVFKHILGEAEKKIGRSKELERFFACVLALPRPIPVSEIASILGIEQVTAEEFCDDLAPGLIRKEGLVGFSDEDFEAFFRDVAKSELERTVGTVSDRFLNLHKTDMYVAFHVAPMLKLAKRSKELIELVENQPEPDDNVISDPIVRQEGATQRLKLAISVCLDAEDSERAMRFVLLGAEAKKTESITRSLLVHYPKLTAKYATETGYRSILSDPELVRFHGPFLLNLMAENAEQQNFSNVRKYRRRFQSWYDLRKENFGSNFNDREESWKFSPEDLACLLYAELRELGPKHAVDRFNSFRLSWLSITSAKIFIQKLVDERSFKDVEQLAKLLPTIRSPFLLVPLALAGHGIDITRLETGVAELLKRSKLTPEVIRKCYRQNNLKFYIVDTILTGVEVLVANGKTKGVPKVVLDQFLDPELRRLDKLLDSDEDLIDAILRCATLSNFLKYQQFDLTNNLLIRLEPPRGERQNRQDDQEQHDKRLRQQIQAISGVYIARAKILAENVKLNEANKILRECCQVLQSERWGFHMSYDFALVRARAAESLSVLLMKKSIRMEVYEAIWLTLGNQWLLNLHKIAPRITPLLELHELFCKKVCKAANARLVENTNANNKSQNLISYAEMLLPVSTDEGYMHFQKSVEVAADISSEIGDQIILLDQLLSFGVSNIDTCHSDYAESLSQIVEDAYTRVEYPHQFPWRNAVSAIARLDTSIALACVARWHDRGIVGLKETLPPLLQIATSTHEISFATALSLFVVSECTDGRELEKLIDSVDQHEFRSVEVEEVARDILQDRIIETDQLCKFVTNFGSGYWKEKFNEYIEFKSNLPHDKDDDSGVRMASSKQGQMILEAYEWERDVLCNWILLKEQADVVVKESQENNGKVSLSTVLSVARRKVEFGDRIKHLNALLKLNGSFRNESIVDAIMAAVMEWKEQLAVKDWCETELPKLIAQHLDIFCPDFHQSSKKLLDALNLSNASPSVTKEILLKGIQENSERLSVKGTLSLASIIASKLEPASRANLFKWYVNRLSRRRAKNKQSDIPLKSLPTSTDESIARFLFALLGDVDLRGRWRAAHAVRRLGRLGVGTLIESIWKEYNRTKEPVFRDPSAPFYWIAARLWLMISLDRVSTESPKEITSLVREIYEVAISVEFPHVLIREYASDAAFKLHSHGVLALGKKELSCLRKVNKSLLPTAEEQDSLDPVTEKLIHRKNVKKRFSFDGLDTLTYWYEPWLWMFSGLSQEDFLEIAEGWIVDKWGYNDDSFTYKEPRSMRFRLNNLEQSTNSHGRLPTIEHYHTHLEWHAMWCTVGQLISSHQFTRPRFDDDNSDKLNNRISYNKLTYPPIWLSDIVGTKPLQIKLWQEQTQLPLEWYSNIEDSVFLSELLPSDRPDYVVVHAESRTCGQINEETINVSSSLVSPQTAHSLVNALQTVESQFDYLMGSEECHSEISEEGFIMKGWLQQPNELGDFDVKDPFCNDIRRMAMMPGTIVSNKLGLSFTYTPYPHWHRTRITDQSFLYEAWGKEGSGDGNYYNWDSVVSSGYRLLIHKEDLAELLAKEGFDLITQVGVKRSEQGTRQNLYGSEEEHQVQFDRIILLRAGGQIEGAERNFGSWRKNM